MNDTVFSKLIKNTSVQLVQLVPNSQIINNVFGISREYLVPEIIARVYGVGSIDICEVQSFTIDKVIGFTPTVGQTINDVLRVSPPKALTSHTDQATRCLFEVTVTWIVQRNTAEEIGMVKQICEQLIQKLFTLYQDINKLCVEIPQVGYETQIYSSEGLTNAKHF